MIQTDARLHLGTSGGPLLNLKGEMVGLCISTAAVSGYESPAGYAIPVDSMFRRVLEVLKQGREAEYGLLGVGPANLTSAEIAAGRQGIHVRRVYANTPAARAGLRGDDIITSVNDRPVYDSDGFVLEVGRLPVEAVAGSASSAETRSCQRNCTQQVQCPRSQDRYQAARRLARHANRLRVRIPGRRAAAAIRNIWRSRGRIRRRGEHAGRRGRREAWNAHQPGRWPARGHTPRFPGGRRRKERRGATEA